MESKDEIYELAKKIKEYIDMENSDSELWSSWGGVSDNLPHAFEEYAATKDEFLGQALYVMSEIADTHIVQDRLMMPATKEVMDILESYDGNVPSEISWREKGDYVYDEEKDESYNEPDYIMKVGIEQGEDGKYETYVDHEPMEEEKYEDKLKSMEGLSFEEKLKAAKDISSGTVKSPDAIEKDRGDGQKGK